MQENTYLNQLKAGHTNGQETIRFIDQKASIVFGIVVFVISSVFFLYQNRFLDDKGNLLTNQVTLGAPISLLGLLILVFSFLSAVLCAASMVSCLKARPPRTPRKTILFPYYSSVQDAEQLLECFKGSQNQESKAIEEYEDQVVVLGTILERKIHYLNCLIRRFIALIVSAALLVGVSWAPLLKL
ncbi:MAG: hypothetical protein Q7Q73_03940 [Verrucomicrobiota bacterium JB024]|nr:hypothetical protein [Verrucomicrobiota bacterium JB024]